MPIKKRHWPWVVLVLFLLVLAAVGGAGYMMLSQAMSAKNHLNTVIDQVKMAQDGDMTEALTKLEPIISTVQSETEAAKKDLFRPAVGLDGEGAGGRFGYCFGAQGRGCAG